MELKEALNILQNILKQDESRPKSFHIGHLVLAIIELSQEAPISREKLSNLLGLGSGAIRSLLLRLVMNHLVSVTSRGIRLKGTGIEISNTIKRCIRGPFEVELEYLRVDSMNVVFVIRDECGKKINPLKIRDLVVRYGGSGSTLCYFSNNKIEIPYVTSNLTELSSHDYFKIKKVGLNEGDTILVVSAPSVVSAKVSGAAAIAESLLELINQV